MVWRTILVGLSIFFVGCTHHRQFSSYDEINSRVLWQSVKISLSDGTLTKGRNVVIRPDSTSWFVTWTSSNQIVATSSVQHLTIVNRDRGAWEGFRGSLIVGAVLGLIGYASGDDEEVIFGFTAGDKLRLGLTAGVVFGVLIGIPVGAAIGSLDKITMPIDSLTNPELYADALKQYNMIKAKGYFDKRLNPGGKGVENDFEVQVIKGDTVIYDAATSLTWQGGSDFVNQMRWSSAQAYVDTLGYAGGGWRLPTLEEAMSLMQPKRNKAGRYIDARFKDTPRIWTSHKYSASRAWCVLFGVGHCSSYDIGSSFYVRAVR